MKSTASISGEWRLFLWTGARYWRQHKLLTLLNVLGIALGTGVFVSIQILNHSSLAAFRAAVDVVAGKANRQIIGAAVALPEEVYTQVRWKPGVRAATPVLETVVPLVESPSQYLRLTGIDPFSNAPFQTFEVQAEEGADRRGNRFLFTTNAVSLTAEMASALDVSEGDRIAVRVGSKERTLQVASLLSFPDSPVGVDRHLAVMDIANAQEFLGRLGELDRVDLLVDEEMFDDETVRKELPGAVKLERPEQRGRKVEQMLGAFQLNLTALSLIALLVGMFLIYNTVSAEVVRRRREIGILKAVGVQAGQVQRLFLGQALLTGIAGVGLGVLGGWWLAERSLEMVSDTISSFYLLLSVEEVFLPVWLVGLGLGSGLGAVLISAWRPALEASRLSSVEVIRLEGHQAPKRVRPWRWLLAGITVLSAGGVLSIWVLAGGLRWVGFAVALAVLVGTSFCVPALMQFLGWLGKPVIRLLGRGIGDVALRTVNYSLGRTGVTIAALGCALAMMMGVSTMIHSFRETVGEWIQQTIQADLYISHRSHLHLGPHASLPEELLHAVRGHTGVREVETYRERAVEIDGLEMRLGGTEFDVRRKHSEPVFLGGDPEEIWRRTIPPEDLQKAELPAGILSESGATRLGVQAGEKVKVATPSGLEEVMVAGIFRDYTTDLGVLMMDVTWWEELFRSTPIHGIALHLEEPVEEEGVEEWVRSRFSPQGELRIYSNGTLKEKIFEIFDQTFAITYLLRFVAVVVAVLGIFLTMTVLVMERGREIGIMRSIGATSGQVRGMVLMESGIMGLAGYLMGLLAGLGLAWVLVFVINRTFFGWTISWHVPSFLFLEAPLWSIGAALLAGWFPAYRASRMSAADALREE